jgi:endonuclease/exonuclease/phosphatase family metal-dependent hydrolase
MSSSTSRLPSRRSTAAPVRLVLATATMIALLLGVGPAEGSPGAPGTPRSPVTVMTWNLYLGADLGPVLTAGSTAELLQGATQVFQQVQENDFPDRAHTIAAQIAEAEPDVIGLQEVALWRTGPVFDQAQATTIAIDYLAELQTALDATDLRYDVVSVVENFDGEVPTLLGVDVRYTDRDVILVRRGVQVVASDAGSFETVLSLPSPVLGTIDVDRGWTSVDIRRGGAVYRVVNTHLEAFGPIVIRTAQTAELVAGPLATDDPTLLIGDLNAQAETPPLQLLAATGFQDAWTGTGGLTCCFPDDLSEDGALYSRIDYILARGWAPAQAVEVLGDEPADQTPSGLWPSDHAGVIATLRLP